MSDSRTSGGSGAEEHGEKLLAISRPGPQAGRSSSLVPLYLALCILLLACTRKSTTPPSTEQISDTSQESGEYPFGGSALPLTALPADAVILERSEIPQHLRADRALILWMVNPVKNPRTSTAAYTCTETTSGSYFRGPTRVSLLDTRKDSIINTIKVTDRPDAVDLFNIPYGIRGGLYYYVPGATETTEGKPVILYLYDYNGDGLPLEFAFFNAVSCSKLQTALLGYVQKDDRLIWYPIRLATTINGENSSSETHQWANYLFSKLPIKPGHWKFTVDYRESGGMLDTYEVTYDQKRMRFSGWLQKTYE